MTAWSMLQSDRWARGLLANLPLRAVTSATTDAELQHHQELVIGIAATLAPIASLAKRKTPQCTALSAQLREPAETPAAARSRALCLLPCCLLLRVSARLPVALLRCRRRR